MKHERYIINEEELELLNRYEGTMAQRKDPYRYDTFPKDSLISFCRMKDKSNDMFFRRYQKAKIKRRLQELEQENAILRSLIQK